MNDREKLIDWISDIVDFVDWEHIEEVADHLIANGVVIQEQGEWVLTTHKGTNYRIFVTAECSNCEHHLGEIWDGYFPYYSDINENMIVLNSAKKAILPSYCQWCGSKMKEVE